jgi:two-component system cell cycle sensor histidine kinase/response regulator CckA
MTDAAQPGACATLGELAGGLAHDFNNLLAIIMTHSVLVLEQLKADDPLRSDLEEVCRAVERAATLTLRLAALGRQVEAH